MYYTLLQQLKNVNIKKVLTPFKRKKKEVFRYEEILYDFINFINGGYDLELDSDGDPYKGE